jgi:streptogramin lyase
MRNVNLLSFATIVAAAVAPLLLAGCGTSGGNITAPHTPPVPVGAVTVTGHVHGGRQPIGGSAVQMYAVGTNGYGSPSVSVLNSGVTVTSSTDGSGSFTLTNLYTCSPDQRVYVTATGGDAGSGKNPAIALMAALGRCGDLTSSTFISLNEVTTVASVWALAPFMNGPANIGAPASNVAGLNNAFADVNELASIATGSAGGAGVPAGMTVPVAAINTLADILAACINSTGADAACTTLFAGATAGGNAPADTLTAAMNMAQHPGAGVAMLYPLASPQSPFVPTLADQPSDFTLAATISGFSKPSAVAADAGGNVWVTDSSANTLTELGHSGAPVMTVPGMSAPSAVAVDQAGDVWVANAGNVAKVTVGGAVSTFTGGGLSLPQSIAIDGQGNVWLANAGNGMLSEFSNSGGALSGTGFASAGGTPIGVGISPN